MTTSPSQSSIMDIGASNGWAEFPTRVPHTLTLLRARSTVTVTFTHSGRLHFAQITGPQATGNIMLDCLTDRDPEKMRTVLGWLRATERNPR